MRIAIILYQGFDESCILDEHHRVGEIEVLNLNSGDIGHHLNRGHRRRRAAGCARVEYGWTIELSGATVKADPILADYCFLVDAELPHSAEYPAPRPADLGEKGEPYAKLWADWTLPSAHVAVEVLIDVREPMVDNRRFIPFGKLGTGRFLDVLALEGVPFTSRPVTLLDRVTGARLPETRNWWIPETVRDVIDLDRCEFVQGASGRRLTKLALRPDVATGLLLFRPAGLPFYIAHERVRSRLEAACISGVAFATLDTAFDPGEGARLLDSRRLLSSRLDDAESWYSVARGWWLVQRYHQALEAIDRALSIRPADSNALHLKGRILCSLGHPAESLRAFEGAVDRQGSAVAIGDYLDALLGMHRVQDAASQLGRLMAVDPDGPRTRLLLAKTQVALGAIDEALTAVEEGLKHFGGSLYRNDLLQVRANALLLQGRFEEALQANEEAIANGPLPRPFLRGKAEALGALGRNEEAEQALKLAEQSQGVDDYVMISRQG